MKVWTAHIRSGAAPVLVREGFTWGGFFLGPFWLLANRAWIAGVLALCAGVLMAFLVRGPVGTILEFALAWLIGLFGRDLVRWSLGRRGFSQAQVVAAPDGEAALARLLACRPDLIADAAR
jgi:Protein of unknown function (DUF2628)